MSYRLFHWLQEQNEKGVAPRRRDLVAQALESFPEGMPLESLCKFKHTLRHKRSQNQWLRRFRLQWNARLAKLPVLPPLPLHLRQEKVRCYFAFFLRFIFFLFSITVSPQAARAWTVPTFRVEFGALFLSPLVAFFIVRHSHSTDGAMLSLLDMKTPCSSTWMNAV